MLQSNGTVSKSNFSFTGMTSVFLLLAVMLTIGACGSTKVYTADKTIVYNGALYNMSNVQKINSSVEGTLANGDKINMRSLDKKGVESLLKEESSVFVESKVIMDSEEMVYRSQNISRYSDYSSMVKKFDGALNNITKFMANKKKTQLKLK